MTTLAYLTRVCSCHLLLGLAGIGSGAYVPAEASGSWKPITREQVHEAKQPGPGYCPVLAETLVAYWDERLQEWVFWPEPAATGGQGNR